MRVVQTPMKPLSLVIENDGSTRRLLDVLLTRTGIEVDVVSTGSDALILLENVLYDFVLLDLLLPGMSGTQLLEWIERERPKALAKCVVLSSASERQLQSVRDRWPGVRVIRKPFELGDIVAAAHELTANREPHTRSATVEFVRRSVRAVAKAGIVVTKSGQQLELLHAFGYRSGEAESYFPLHVEAQVPLCAAIRNARPVWLASLTVAAAEYPLLAPVFEKSESRALAVVPLMRGEDVIGAAGWSFREPRLFTDGEQQLLGGIAAAVAEILPDGTQQSTTVAGA